MSEPAKPRLKDGTGMVTYQHMVSQLEMTKAYVTGPGIAAANKAAVYVSVDHQCSVCEFGKIHEEVIQEVNRDGIIYRTTLRCEAMKRKFIKPLMMWQRGWEPESELYSVVDDIAMCPDGYMGLHRIPLKSLDPHIASHDIPIKKHDVPHTIKDVDVW